MALAVSTLQARFDKRYKEGTITEGFVALLIYHTRHYYERYKKAEDFRCEYYFEATDRVLCIDKAAIKRAETLAKAENEALKKCWAMRLMTEDATLLLENPSAETLKAYAQAMVDTSDDVWEIEPEYKMIDGIGDVARCGDDPVEVLESFGDLYEQIHDRLPPAVDWNA